MVGKIARAILVFLAIAVVFVGGFLVGMRRHARITDARDFQKARMSAPLLGRSAPAFSMKTLAGEPWALPEKKGKVIVLDFWATWCRPCIQALPELKRIQRRYGSRPDFELVGIALDPGLSDVEQFCEENGIEWTQLIDPGLEFESAGARAFGVQTIPSVWVINREGRLVGIKARYGELQGLLAGLLGG